MPSKNNRYNKKRTRGWVGTRIEVCGHPLQTAEADLVCHLPPNHHPKNIHASIAQDLDPSKSGVTVVIVQDNEKEKILWQDVDPP